MLLNNNHQADAHLYSSMKFRLFFLLLLHLLLFIHLFSRKRSVCSVFFVCVPFISMHTPFVFISLALANKNFWMKTFAED